MDLFATADLRKRLHIEPHECADVAAPDPLRSWYGHVRQVGRLKFIVLVHAETRFTVVLNAKGIVDVRALHEQWSLAFPQVAATMRLTRDRIAPLLTNAPQRVAKAEDRRVLGTINDWFRTIQFYGEEGHAVERVQLSCLLNDTPIIGGDIGFPRDRFASFVGSQARNPRERMMDAPRSGGPGFGAASLEGPEMLQASPATHRKGLAHCGEWTITQMPYFADGALDECVEPRINIDARGQGHMQFCALTADLDVRAEQRTDHVSLTWTWQGDDDGTELRGRGEATVRGDRMTGRIVIHHGDELTFVATRDR